MSDNEERIDESAGEALEPVVMGSGITDKNGVEILDGHNLLVTHYSHWEKGKAIASYEAEVRFRNAAFRLVSRKRNNGTWIESDEDICIGNFCNHSFEVLNP